MRQIATLKPLLDLRYLGMAEGQQTHYQCTPEELIEASVKNQEGMLCSNGALAVDTGEFTGRSPKDRFIVLDSMTEKAVWWGDVNIAITPSKFDKLYDKVIAYLANKPVYVRDSFVCADPEHRLSLRVITEHAFQSLFAYNMFIQPQYDLADEQPQWTIISAPGFKADPTEDGTRQHNFSIINFSRKTILIGGTGYTGEIKKGMFSVLNLTLPRFKKVLPMHCSANKGANGDTAIFFGLSGTGKTTLSADPARELIGDDEHGWSDTSVFNFEGGCYAKTAGLSQEKEPEIFDAIRYGSLLENVNFLPGTNEVDFDNIDKTENTRVSYPIHYIKNAALPSIGDAPKNIFFLTADAFGVLPPISKLTAGQAMYYFISGYTAKVAGTEHGINEPQATFSACFGKAFLPMHPVEYADLLGKKLRKHPVQVWLINTGWSGGAYGTGKRISLSYTRAMIRAALNGELNTVAFNEHPVFGLMVPERCPGVPSEILNPADTWTNREAYDKAATHLAELFVSNFNQYADVADAEIIASGPQAKLSAAS